MGKRFWKERGRENEKGELATRRRGGVARKKAVQIKDRTFVKQKSARGHPSCRTAPAWREKNEKAGGGRRTIKKN